MRRRNPHVGTHPDLFEGATPIFKPLSELDEDEIAALPRRAFNFDEWQALKYLKAANNGTGKAWSIRTESGRRKFAIFADLKADGSIRRIDQAEGTMNRLPGFPSSTAGGEGIKGKFKPTEVGQVAEFIASLGIDPFTVNDIAPGLKKMIEVADGGNSEAKKLAKTLSAFVTPTSGKAAFLLLPQEKLLEWARAQADMAVDPWTSDLANAMIRVAVMAKDGDPESIKTSAALKKISPEFHRAYNTIERGDTEHVYRANPSRRPAQMCRRCGGERGGFCG
jgi:hypothetical protein